MNAEHYMREALKEAAKAKELGEVPVGAVIVVDDRTIARAHNETERCSDATAHAELLAIRRASEVLSNWRLSGASLFVTLEPCTMCIGAMVLSRIEKLYYGCTDPRQGAVGSLFDLSRFPMFPHEVEVFPGLLAQEAENLLKEFFKDRRSR